MKRLIMVAVALLAGCNTTDSGAPREISPGVYQSKLGYQGSNTGVTLSMESNFGADGSYRGKIYVDDGTNGCLLVDGAGKWKASGSSYILMDLKIQSRETCSDALSGPEGVDDDTTQVRNITGSSFEEYTEFENQPATWIKQSKI